MLEGYKVTSRIDRRQETWVKKPRAAGSLKLQPRLWGDDPASHHNLHRTESPRRKGPRKWGSSSISKYLLRWMLCLGGNRIDFRGSMMRDNRKKASNIEWAQGRGCNRIFHGCL